MPTAVVTGPTSGMGLAFARALAGEGYDLMLVSRDEQRLGRVRDELQASYGVRCEVLAADLASLEDTRRVEARLHHGPLDLLVNNAGFGTRPSFEAADIEDEQRSLDVLVRAVLRLTHAGLLTMLAQGRGEILNVSSVAGFLPRGTYGAHKAWVTSFSAWCNVRYRKQGVRVTALCPGYVHTEFHERMGADMHRIPSWMWLQADDVVRSALRDLRAGKAISIPSRRYKLLIGASRLVPRSVTERLARRGR